MKIPGNDYANDGQIMAKIAELQARVEAEKVRVIATQALEAQPQEHYETYYEIANCIELHADELKKIAEGE